MISLNRFNRRPVRLLAITALTMFAMLLIGCSKDEGQPSTAADHPHGVEVSGAWARATAGNPNENGAVYLVVKNLAHDADQLRAVSVAASVAKVAETHTMEQQGGSMMMKKVENGWAVPAEGTLKLEPGGNHIMLIGLARQLKAGETFDVTLDFEHAGPQTVKVEVRAADAAAPAAPTMAH